MHLPFAEEKRHVAEISCCAGGTHVLQNGSLAFLFGAPGHQERHLLSLFFELGQPSGYIAAPLVSILPTNPGFLPRCAPGPTLRAFKGM